MIRKIKLKKLKAKYLLIVVASCLLLVTAIYQKVCNKQDILGLLQQAEPAASYYKKIVGSYETYELLDSDGKFLSYAVISSASGYGGPITMLTTISREGAIENAVLLDDAETPAYLNQVLEMGYPENLQGKSVSNLLISNSDIDAVSGATKTTEGILGAVEKGMVQVGKNQLKISVPALETYQFHWNDVLVTLFLILALVVSTRKMIKLRPLLLVISVILIGFMTQSALSLGNFISILINKMPVFVESPIWFLLVFGIILITIISGMNLYCAWICPFGAVQEGVYKALNLTNNRPDKRLRAFARKSRLFFIWLATMLGLYFSNPWIASYEPFSVFFNGQGVTAQWIIMGVSLLMSIIILRFWCHYFCPIGAVLDFIAQIKVKIKKLFSKKTVLQPASLKKDVLGCSTCESYMSGCEITERKTMPLSSFNIFLACIIIIINLLIIWALLQNIGLDLCQIFGHK